LCFDLRAFPCYFFLILSSCRRAHWSDLPILLRWIVTSPRPLPSSFSSPFFLVRISELGGRWSSQTLLWYRASLPSNLPLRKVSVVLFCAQYPHSPRTIPRTGLSLELVIEQVTFLRYDPIQSFGSVTPWVIHNFKDSLGWLFLFKVRCQRRQLFLATRKFCLARVTSLALFFFHVGPVYPIPPSSGFHQTPYGLVLNSCWFSPYRPSFPVAEEPF